MQEYNMSHLVSVGLNDSVLTLLTLLTCLSTHASCHANMNSMKWYEMAWSSIFFFPALKCILLLDEPTKCLSLRFFHSVVSEWMSNCHLSLLIASRVISIFDFEPSIDTCETYSTLLYETYLPTSGFAFSLLTHYSTSDWREGRRKV